MVRKRLYGSSKLFQTKTEASVTQLKNPFMYITNQLPPYKVHTRNTRNNDKLNIPFFRSATGQRSFSYRAVQLWNDLPESLTNMESFNVFKNAIKGRALDKFLSR